jgi:signal peptidase I
MDELDAPVPPDAASVTTDLAAGPLQAPEPPVESTPVASAQVDYTPIDYTLVEHTPVEHAPFEHTATPVAPVPAVTSAPIPPQENPWVRMGREVLSGFQTLVSAAVYATLIVTFGFQVARVDGLSMAPTLEDHDRLIVNKLVYELGDPRPGDIVMLYYPVNPEKMFVKRVIAKEGDTVRIVDGRVFVNDVPLHDDYVSAEFRSHDDYGPEVVKQGYYFVMGDHRNNSSDSRHWGWVPKKYIVGKVKLRWWPLQDARIFQ